MFTKIAIATDHRADKYVDYVKDKLLEFGIEPVVATYDQSANNDYPDVVKQTYKLFATGKVDGMVLLCGTGVGMNIAANKCKNIRCVYADNPTIAAFGRLHEDANALAIGVGYTNENLRLSYTICKRQIGAIIKAFVTTKFEGDRHIRRVEKLNKMC